MLTILAVILIYAAIIGGVTLVIDALYRRGR